MRPQLNSLGRHVRWVLSDLVDDGAVGGDLAGAAGDFHRYAGVVQSAEAEVADGELSEFVGIEIKAQVRGNLRVLGDDGDLDRDRAAGRFDEADVRAIGAGALKLQELQGTVAEADGLRRRDGGDELPVGAGRGLVVRPGGD